MAKAPENASTRLIYGFHAVSAKLRQLQPRIAAALAAKGIKVNAIRVRVASNQNPTSF